MVIAKPEWFKNSLGILIMSTALVGGLINMLTRYKLEKDD